MGKDSKLLSRFIHVNEPEWAGLNCCSVNRKTYTLHQRTAVPKRRCGSAVLLGRRMKVPRNNKLLTWEIFIELHIPK